MNPGPPAKDTPANAEGHVTANAVLAACFAGLHLLFLISCAANLVMHAYGLHGPMKPASTPEGMGERVGFFVGMGVVGVWSLAGLIWLPINLFGLLQRRPWARTSMMAYWAFATFFCCCLPVWAYGLWSLTRPHVKALLDGNKVPRADVFD